MIIVRAPVRISFGGGGTDLAAYYKRFGGLVVSAAITRYCSVLVNEPLDERIHISSADYHSWQTYDKGVKPPQDARLALPQAVLSWFIERDWLQAGVDLFLSCEVAPGTGLGSSSAMTVALIHALAAYCGRKLSATEVAELACDVEIERLGMPIGKQDHYASALGGLNTLEFTAEGVHVIPLVLTPEILATLQSRLLLFTTGLARNSADILGQQQANTEKQPATIEVLHRMKELAAQIQQALMAGKLDRFGELLDQGWHEKKRLANNVSSEKIDQWYATARQAGALGGKITGAGGGGFLLFYCPVQQQVAVRAALTHCGLQEMTFDFDLVGPQISTHSWS